MPRISVPDQARVASKWARRAGSAGPEYTDGVKNTPRSWATNTKAAEASYAAGVNEAIAKKRFGKGVDTAGDAKWKRGAEEKGSQRYGQGVQTAEGDYGTGVGPYLSAIGSIDLPARGPVGSDGNYSRVAAIGRALRQLKMSR
jgi:hypothetical protein